MAGPLVADNMLLPVHGRLRAAPAEDADVVAAAPAAIEAVATFDAVATAAAAAATSPPTVSSPTAQSTNGSYTNASSRVSNVSRPRFNVFSTCSQAKRNVPCKINVENKVILLIYDEKRVRGREVENMGEV